MIRFLQSPGKVKKYLLGGLLVFISITMMLQLVDYMITDRAQLLQAQRLGLRVSDAELKDELQHGPLSTYIFPDGKFVGQEKYQNFVTQQLQSSVEHFEEQERNYILQRK